MRDIRNSLRSDTFLDFYAAFSAAYLKE